MISLLNSSVHDDQYHSNHKLKKKYQVHRQYKIPDFDNTSRFNILRGSPNSSRKYITIEPSKQSLDCGSAFQGFQIRVLKPQERYETQKEEKYIPITKSAQLKRRKEKKEDNINQTQDDLLLPKFYSPIQTPRKLALTKMKESIYKPFFSKSENVDHIITINSRSQIYDQLNKGMNLKCLYFSQRQETIDKIIVINFDNLILGKRKSFWEQSSEIKLCSKLFASQCDNSFCSCVLQKDLKSTLQLLSKHFYVIFIFECGLRGSTWSSYLIDCGFVIDAIYCIQKSKLCGGGGGLKMKQIISHFGKSQIRELIYFGLIDTDLYSDNLPIEQFYYQIPIVQQQVSVQIFLMQLQKSKSIDSKLLYEISMLHCNQKDSFNYKKWLNVIKLNLQPIISQMIQMEQEDEISNSIFKNLNLDHSQRNISDEEEDKNSLLQWLYQTKRLLLDYFKSINSEEQNQNPITLIGDFLRRNSSIEMNFLTQDYVKQAKRFNLYNELKASTTAQATFRKQSKMECFVIQD
ncbi:unnamed protein product (macronuclear) [Paramecium tetraurelia]|uniref:3'-5' exonuclease domain-containing protein n=1 Tax=Paramecium tetraurelia TaxID=5888 RepID=A0CCN8_PARTE|nr:uncharacterized protein GSPATT00037340001 [Paramecium tetraurelia]CAK68555.1 unnamed protein product [Paramecium tetraurelia]|eukprot:XP_001435952.1 hypothetical protein (macronuclear) [Paramecium tetraurelia strain d4-2]